MGSARALALLGAALSLFLRSGRAQDNNASTTLVPAIFTLGDSASDPHNNDYLPTIVKANYSPYGYGRDFVDCKATGRFCNGKLVANITAETMGFTTYPLPYLSPETTIFLCNPKSLRTCHSATKYVFSASVHPAQAANQFLSDRCFNPPRHLPRIARTGSHPRQNMPPGFRASLWRRKYVPFH